MSSANVDLSESRGSEILGAIISTYCVAVVVILLRILARRISNVGFWIDDWLVFVGAAIYTVVVALFIECVKLGAGWHIQTVDPAVFETIEIYFYITEITFSWAIGLVKCSVLAFYWRIFGVSSIRIPIWITVAVVWAWIFAFTFATTFQCTPAQRLWKTSIPGHCVSKFAIFLGTSIPEIVTDFIILVMPIPYIWRLQIKPKQKVSLTIVFLLGGFACISSIIRLWAFMVRDYSSPDLTWTTVDPSIWSCVEGSFAIISACLPSLRPILTYLRTGSATPTTKTEASRAALARGESRGVQPIRSMSMSRPLQISDDQLRGSSFEDACRNNDSTRGFWESGRAEQRGDSAKGQSRGHGAQVIGLEDLQHRDQAEPDTREFVAV